MIKYYLDDGKTYLEAGNNFIPLLKLFKTSLILKKNT